MADEVKGRDSGDGRSAAGGAPAGGVVATKRRESALEKLKRQLAESSADMPPLEGYEIRKALKILRAAGFPADKVRIRYIDAEEARGQIVRQYPDAGEKIDLRSETAQIELCVADRSAMDFLPSIYQRSDISGRNFLRDFLWIFQHLFNQTREKLDNIHTYFDPLDTPEKFLPWLGSWVAMVVDEDWPDVKKRNIIRKAVELYHLRGTVRGIRIYLKIFTGVEPVILENFWPFDGIQISPYTMDPEVLDEKGKPIDPTRPDYDDLKKSKATDWKGSTIGEDMIELPYIDKAHVFTVDLPMLQEQLEVDMIKKIHRILDREKPAHTDYYVRFQEEEEKETDTAIVVGVSSTIGVDTFMGGE